MGELGGSALCPALWIYPSGHWRGWRARWCAVGRLKQRHRERGACPWSHAELLWPLQGYCVRDGLAFHSWGSPNCSFILFYSPLLEPEGLWEWLTDITMRWTHCQHFPLNLLSPFISPQLQMPGPRLVNYVVDQMAESLIQKHRSGGLELFCWGCLDVCICLITQMQNKKTSNL